MKSKELFVIMTNKGFLWGMIHQQTDYKSEPIKDTACKFVMTTFRPLLHGAKWWFKVWGQRVWFTLELSWSKWSNYSKFYAPFISFVAYCLSIKCIYFTSIHIVPLQLYLDKVWVSCNCGTHKDKIIVKIIHHVHVDVGKILVSKMSLKSIK